MKDTTINEDGHYEVLESKYLIQRPWLTARLDSAKLSADVRRDIADSTRCAFVEVFLPEWKIIK